MRSPDLLQRHCRRSLKLWRHRRRNRVTQLRADLQRWQLRTPPNCRRCTQSRVYLFEVPKGGSLNSMICHTELQLGFTLKLPFLLSTLSTSPTPSTRPYPKRCSTSRASSHRMVCIGHAVRSGLCFLSWRQTLEGNLAWGREASVQLTKRSRGEARSAPRRSKPFPMAPWAVSALLCVSLCWRWWRLFRFYAPELRCKELPLHTGGCSPPL